MTQGLHPRDSNYPNYDELAAATGLSPTTIKNHVAAMWKTLWNLLDEYEYHLKTGAAQAENHV
jgi:hypothetical protein